MKRETVIMTILLLVMSIALISNVRTVEANATIYIRADGSVDPSTAPIQRNGDIYTFTANIYDSIVVQRGNIIIDGDGYTLQGSGSGNGFDWSTIDNVTIKNANIKGFASAIFARTSFNNTISKNNITNNEGRSIYLASTSNNIISGNNITNNLYGISLWASSSSTVQGNNIIFSWIDGIEFNQSPNNTISGNNIALGNQSGIDLVYSSDNRISGNNISANNGWGIILYESSTNAILGNNITYNGLLKEDYGGIGSIKSSNGVIYHNNFIDNFRDVFFYYAGYANIWDDGYPSGGNYWSDYTGTDSDGDGIGDTAYVIDVNNLDRYPLMVPWVQTPLTVLYISPQMINATAGENFTVVLNIENVTNLFGWQVVLRWNPQILNLTKVTQGDFLKSNGEIVGGNFINRTEGRAFLFAFYSYLPNEVSGSGTLVNLLFQGIKTGVSVLPLVDTKLFNSNPELVSTPPNLGDVNNDSAVDQLDAIIISTVVGSKNAPNADFDADGIVDLFDLLCVLFNAGKTYPPYPNSGKAWRPVEIPHRIIGFHNVAVTDVSTSKTVVGQGYTIYVMVTIENQGDSTETFNVTAYYNETAITIEQWPDGNNSQVYWSMGDVNRDGYIDYWDLYIISKAFGSEPGDPRWNPDADINSDGIVTSTDMAIWGKNIGKDIWTSLGLLKLIESQRTVTLASVNSTTITFRWNTTGSIIGNYTISAYVWPVPSEINTADNNLTDDMIYVGIPGDINSDNNVDIYDAIILANAYNSRLDSTNWNANADINSDANVDIYDALILAGNYNRSV